MTRYLQYSETFAVTNAAPEDLHVIGEELMKALLTYEVIGDVTDAAVSTDSGQMTVEVEMGMHAADEVSLDYARIVFRSTVRAAAHSTGAGTPQWDVTPLGRYTAGPGVVEVIEDEGDQESIEGEARELTDA